MVKALFRPVLAIGPRLEEAPEAAGEADGRQRLREAGGRQASGA